MLTPEDTLSDCIDATPAFGPYWAAEDTFRTEGGSFTECAVYLTLTWFLRENWRSITGSEWRALAHLAADHDRRAEVPAGTVGACLMEGLEGEEYPPLVTKYFDAQLLSRYGFSA